MGNLLHIPSNKPRLLRLMNKLLIIILLVTAVILTACDEAPLPTSGSITPDLVTPTLSETIATSVLPTSTVEPVAATVNGEAITQATFQIEIEQYAAALGRELDDAEEQQVIDSLINQVLLAQAASEQGASADEKLVQERIDTLVKSLGSKQALDTWMQSNGYSEDHLRTDLARSIEAAWMRDQIIALAPTTAEQIHVRQILARSAEDADGYYSRLQAGSNFDALASQADPITGGELGWLPRGALFYPELEEAAFNLQPGNYTQVIQTAAGYHILLVVERDPARALNPDALLQAQRQSLETWLDERRQDSEIVIY